MFGNGAPAWAYLGHGGRVWRLAAPLELHDLSEGRAVKTIPQEQLAWADGNEAVTVSTKEERRVL